MAPLTVTELKELSGQLAALWNDPEMEADEQNFVLRTSHIVMRIMCIRRGEED